MRSDGIPKHSLKMFRRVRARSWKLRQVIERAHQPHGYPAGPSPARRNGRPAAAFSRVEGAGSAFAPNASSISRRANIESDGTVRQTASNRRVLERSAKRSLDTCRAAACADLSRGDEQILACCRISHRPHSVAAQASFPSCHGSRRQPTSGSDCFGSVHAGFLELRAKFEKCRFRHERMCAGRRPTPSAVILPRRYHDRRAADGLARRCVRHVNHIPRRQARDAPSGWSVARYRQARTVPA